MGVNRETRARGVASPSVIGSRCAEWCPDCIDGTNPTRDLEALAAVLRSLEER